MFITTLFIIAKLWKPRYPSTNQWIKKMYYILTMEYYSATRKSNEIGDHNIK
jgi:hypothetical protein